MGQLSRSLDFVDYVFFSQVPAIDSVDPADTARATVDPQDAIDKLLNDLPTEATRVKAIREAIGLDASATGPITQEEFSRLLGEAGSQRDCIALINTIHTSSLSTNIKKTLSQLARVMDFVNYVFFYQIPEIDRVDPSDTARATVDPQDAIDKLLNDLPTDAAFVRGVREALGLDASVAGPITQEDMAKVLFLKNSPLDVYRVFCALGDDAYASEFGAINFDAGISPAVGDKLVAANLEIVDVAGEPYAVRVQIKNSSKSGEPVVATFSLRPSDELEFLLKQGDVNPGDLEFEYSFNSGTDWTNDFSTFVTSAGEKEVLVRIKMRKVVVLKSAAATPFKITVGGGPRQIALFEDTRPHPAQLFGKELWETQHGDEVPYLYVDDPTFRLRSPRDQFPSVFTSPHGTSISAEFDFCNRTVGSNPENFAEYSRTQHLPSGTQFGKDPETDSVSGLRANGVPNGAIQLGLTLPFRSFANAVAPNVPRGYFGLEGFNEHDHSGHHRGLILEGGLHDLFVLREASGRFTIANIDQVFDPTAAYPSFNVNPTDSLTREIPVDRDDISEDAENITHKIGGVDIQARFGDFTDIISIGPRYRWISGMQRRADGAEVETFTRHIPAIALRFRPHKIFGLQLAFGTETRNRSWNAAFDMGGLTGSSGDHYASGALSESNHFLSWDLKFIPGQVFNSYVGFAGHLGFNNDNVAPNNDNGLRSYWLGAYGRYNGGMHGRPVSLDARLSAEISHTDPTDAEQLNARVRAQLGLNIRGGSTEFGVAPDGGDLRRLDGGTINPYIFVEANSDRMTIDGQDTVGTRTNLVFGGGVRVSMESQRTMKKPVAISTPGAARDRAPKKPGGSERTKKAGSSRAAADTTFRKRIIITTDRPGNIVLREKHLDGISDLSMLQLRFTPMSPDEKENVTYTLTPVSGKREIKIDFAANRGLLVPVDENNLQSVYKVYDPNLSKVIGEITVVVDKPRAQKRADRLTGIAEKKAKASGAEDVIYTDEGEVRAFRHKGGKDVHLEFFYDDGHTLSQLPPEAAAAFEVLNSGPGWIRVRYAPTVQSLHGFARYIGDNGSLTIVAKAVHDAVPGATGATEKVYNVTVYEGDRLAAARADMRTNQREMTTWVATPCSEIVNPMPRTISTYDVSSSFVMLERVHHYNDLNFRPFFKKLAPDSTDPAIYYETNGGGRISAIVWNGANFKLTLTNPNVIGIETQDQMAEYLRDVFDDPELMPFLVDVDNAGQLRIITRPDSRTNFVSDGRLYFELEYRPDQDPDRSGQPPRQHLEFDLLIAD